MPQAHAYWQHIFLKTAGLPVTVYNVNFLTRWAAAGGANGCDHNMLQLSHREPGSTRCKRLANGKFSRNYTDTQSAANAFADQLTISAYPTLRKGLAAGDPFSRANPSGVALDLQKWGAVQWQKVYAQKVGLPDASNPGKPVPKSKNVGGAWTHLSKVLARDGHKTIVELRRATAALNRIDRRLRRA